MILIFPNGDLFQWNKNSIYLLTSQPRMGNSNGEGGKNRVDADLRQEFFFFF